MQKLGSSPKPKRAPGSCPLIQKELQEEAATVETNTETKELVQKAAALPGMPPVFEALWRLAERNRLMGTAKMDPAVSSLKAVALDSGCPVIPYIGGPPNGPSAIAT